MPAPYTWVNQIPGWQTGSTFLVTRLVPGSVQQLKHAWQPCIQGQQLLSPAEGVSAGSSQASAPACIIRRVRQGVAVGKLVQMHD